jgi:hypothetical protein
MNDGSTIDDFFSLIISPVKLDVNREFRLYYDSSGKVVTYTTEDLPGEYIVITQEQYTEARPDVLVKNKKMMYTHLQRYVFKLEKNIEGIACSKYDISIITTDSDAWHWKQQSYEITRGSN